MIFLTFLLLRNPSYENAYSFEKFFCVIITQDILIEFKHYTVYGYLVLIMLCFTRLHISGVDIYVKAEQTFCQQQVCGQAFWLRIVLCMRFVTVSRQMPTSRQVPYHKSKLFFDAKCCFGTRKGANLTPDMLVSKQHPKWCSMYLFILQHNLCYFNISKLTMFSEKCALEYPIFYRLISFDTNLHVATKHSYLVSTEEVQPRCTVESQEVVTCNKHI